MLKNILTGGIDLPKLSNEVASLRLASEETNAALADHIAKANTHAQIEQGIAERLSARVTDNWSHAEDRFEKLTDLVASRALGEDVETLRLKLERMTADVEDTYSVLAGDKSLSDRLNRLAYQTSVDVLTTRVATLEAQIAALTATKLAEVKSRKKPVAK